MAGSLRLARSIGGGESGNSKPLSAVQPSPGEKRAASRELGKTFSDFGGGLGRSYGLAGSAAGFRPRLEPVEQQQPSVAEEQQKPEPLPSGGAAVMSRDALLGKVGKLTDCLEDRTQPNAGESVEDEIMQRKEALMVIQNAGYEEPGWKHDEKELMKFLEAEKSESKADWRSHQALMKKKLGKDRVGYLLYRAAPHSGPHPRLLEVENSMPPMTGAYLAEVTTHAQSALQRADLNILNCGQQRWTKKRDRITEYNEALVLHKCVGLRK